MRVCGVCMRLCVRACVCEREREEAETEKERIIKRLNRYHSVWHTLLLEQVFDTYSAC